MAQLPRAFLAVLCVWTGLSELSGIVWNCVECVELCRLRCLLLLHVVLSIIFPSSQIRLPVCVRVSLSLASSLLHLLHLLLFDPLRS